MRARRAFWLKIGLWPAFGAALLPVLAALFHLLPAIAAAPAPHHDHHDYAATVELVAALEDDCHPPDEPCGEPRQTRVAHCALCLWLQSLHALPATLASALPLPASRPCQVARHEPPTLRAAIHSTSQPRAPPISPAV